MSRQHTRTLWWSWLTTTGVLAIGLVVFGVRLIPVAEGRQGHL